MNKDVNAINWFEIPALDINRAKKFYESIFKIEMTEIEMMGLKLAMFPYDGSKGTAGGTLAQSQNHKPGKNGVIIYLNANPNLQTVLDKIGKAGGKVTMPKTQIDEQSGYMAFFTDTEGNNIGLHSNE